MGLLGIHASIAGGVHNAFAEAEQLKCEAMQIFTANQRQWDVKPITEEDVIKFKSLHKKSCVKRVISHASYLINLAAFNPENLKKSRSAFTEELRRARLLGLDGVVIHPGSTTGCAKEQGIKTIAESIDICLSECGGFTAKILLETTAGSGNAVGAVFEEIAAVIERVKERSKLGVCFDTAHTFAAGYDLTRNYEGIFRDFDGIIGLKRLKAFHLNDSKTGFASRRDRHEHIGKGNIGKELFRKLVTDKRFEETPMILETPADGGMDEKNIKFLRKLGKLKK